MTCDLEGR